VETQYRNTNSKITDALRIIKKIVLLSIIIIISGCNAPRENPLDPNNPNSKVSSIEGYIKTESVPRTPLSSVVISNQKGSIVAETNNAGYFEITSLEQDVAYLIFNKEGYKKDSIKINWDGEKKVYVESYLNQIPHLDSLRIYSIVMSRYSLPPLSQLVVKAKVSDSDKDMDSLIMQCESAGFSQYMTYNTNDKYYGCETYLYDLPVGNLEELIGKEIKIISRESKGELNVIGKGSLIRVISKAIDFISPSNYDTVSGRPVLKWYDYESGFSYYQNVEIYGYELDFSNVLVWSKSGISADSLSVEVDKDLPTGNYFWVIYCVDEFSNKIRSNPASFYIRNSK